MQLVQGAIFGLDSPPDQRVDALEGDLELVEPLVGGNLGGAGLGFRHGPYPFFACGRLPFTSGMPARKIASC